jgi:hypothetical protein
MHEGLAQDPHRPAKEHSTTAHLVAAQLRHRFRAAHIAPEERFQLLAETGNLSATAEAARGWQTGHLVGAELQRTLDQLEKDAPAALGANQGESFWRFLAARTRKRGATPLADEPGRVVGLGGDVFSYVLFGAHCLGKGKSVLCSPQALALTRTLSWNLRF